MNRKKIAKNTGSMSLAVLISRILGLLRDIIMTGFFGTTAFADAFQVAYQIPNLLRKLFGEGALSAAFIPVYNDIGLKKSTGEQIKFALNVLSILSAFLMLLCGLGMLLTPFIVKLLAPGFDPEVFALTVKLTRIIFPYLFLIGFSSTLISILNSHDYFFVPGLSSAFLNVAMIGTLGIVYLINPELDKEIQITYWSFGVILGGILQTIVNLPLLHKVGYKIKLNFNLRGKDISSVWTRFIPGVIGLAIRQVNLAVDLILASFLVTGSIAALNYGNRIMQLPLGIIGVSAGVAVLPLFSRLVSGKDWQNLGDSIKFSLLGLALIMIPITAFMIALGEDLTRVIFMRGAFNEDSLKLTYLALACYSSGLFFYSANRIIIPVFYANGDTKTPVKISAVIVSINIILNIILMKYLAHAGLALATAISAMIHYFVLRWRLKIKIPQLSIPKLKTEILKVSILSFAILFILINLRRLVIQDSFINSIIILIIGSFVTLFFLLVGVKILKIQSGNRVLSELWERIKKKLN